MRDLVFSVAQNLEFETIFLGGAQRVIWGLWRERDQRGICGANVRQRLVKTSESDIAIRAPTAAIPCNDDGPPGGQIGKLYGLARGIRQLEVWRLSPTFRALSVTPDLRTASIPCS